VSTSLSVVIPAWNEAAVIEDLLTDLRRELAGRFRSLEVIVVDDCSTDGTAAILDRVAQVWGELRVEHASVNRGHGPSVAHGLELAGGDWIFQTDSDRQFPPAEFWRLWERRTDADLVLGGRTVRRDSRARLVLSTVINAVVSALVARRVRDANTPFRLVRKELLHDVRPLLGDAPRAPSILVTVAAVARGWRVLEVPVTHLARTHGTSSLAAWRLVRFSLAGLLELLRFRYELTRAAPPGRAVEAAR
jgi:glycosyltransferase involved in cell wall biosynthesis